MPCLSRCMSGWLGGKEPLYRSTSCCYYGWGCDDGGYNDEGCDDEGCDDVGCDDEGYDDVGCDDGGCYDVFP